MTRPGHLLCVAVLAGGRSAEREISLESGEAVSGALAGRGHRVSTIDPAADNLAGVMPAAFDAAFIALHGSFGEDGGVQRMLEDCGVPYTGSGPLASRLAFVKSAAKERFRACGVPTPPSMLVRDSDSTIAITAAADRLGYPLVVKPDAQGSSLGVGWVHGPGDLYEALEAAFDLGEFALLETAVVGTEWTVSLLDNHPLPAISIDAGSDRELFDFDAKYRDQQTGYTVHRDPGRDARAVLAVGRQAAAAVGTRGIARVDIRLDDAGRPWVLEINTVPGMTAHSLVPKAAAAEGIDLGRLCERQLLGCLNRHRGLRGWHIRQNRTVASTRATTG